MARKQGKKAEVVIEKQKRLSLEEVKAQTGRYLFVNYQGVSKGGFSLPAPRPRFAGDVVQELMILPFDPQMIGDEWLDEPRFIRLFNSVPEIVVWKSDDIPVPIDTTVPEELNRTLNDAQKAYARLIALSPYDDRMKDVLEAQDREHSEEEVIRSNRRVILPFLKLVQFYELRWMQRPEVLAALDKRIRTILSETSRMETAATF